MTEVALAVIFLNVTHGAADSTIADFRKNPMPGPKRQYQMGKLTSPVFTIEHGYLVLELHGTYHPEKCCAASRRAPLPTRPSATSCSSSAVMMPAASARTTWPG